MSSLIARVAEIHNSSSLHIVKFDFHGEILSMMSLDLNENVKVGAKVRLVVKPTHVLITKNFSTDISCANRLNAIVDRVENGELLSSIELSLFEDELESILTREMSNAMSLQVGDVVMAFIQESELSIGEILDD